MAVTQRFTSPGTFSTVVPPNCSRVRIICKGADAGGGSGRKTASNVAGSGGGGGSAGAKNDTDLPLELLGVKAGDLFSGTVGAPGIGGAAQTVNSSNGSTGTNGGASWVVRGASGLAYMVYSNGGLAGQGGLTTAAVGGSASQGMHPSLAGGASSITANSGDLTLPGVNARGFLVLRSDLL